MPSFMAWQALKDKLLYEKVNLGRIQQLRVLWNCGAGLEWRDSEGKTPLIVACLRHDRFDIAKALINFGANVNAYRPGKNGGTPLHHAIMKGHDQIVKLLLENGANPFLRNDDGYTALELARKRGRFMIVRTIESHMSIFAGWLRAECTSVLNGAFKPIASDFRPGKVWAVVLPSDTVEPTRPLKLELVMYLAQEVAEPFEVIKLMETHIDQPDFSEPDPFGIIESSGTRYRLFSEYWGEKQQTKLFFNACRGALEANGANTASSPNQLSRYPPAARRRSDRAGLSRSTHSANSAPEQPLVHRTVPVPTSLTNSASSAVSTGIASSGTIESYMTDLEDIELARAIKASIETAIAEGIQIEPHLVPERSATGTTVSHPEPMSSDTSQEETFYDASANQSTVTSTIFDDNTATGSTDGSQFEEEEAQRGLCVVCLDAQVEAACIPCGHMAGCLACLKKIEAKNKKCPVCRATVDQVVKIYTI